MASSFLRQLNVRRSCREEFGVSVWRCPTFLFIVIGFIVILSVVAAYIIASRYSSDPELSALLALGTAAITFTLGNIILHSITKVVQVSKMKSQFLNLISHQLLTPLTAVKWSVNALEDPSIISSSQEQRELLSAIKENSNTLIQAVNELLDVSRLETGKLKLNLEKCDIAKIVKQAVVSHQAAADAKRLKIIYEEGQDVSFVSADQARLKVVVQQLLDNAIKYSKEGSSISIAVRPEGSSVMCRVEDAGAGIPEAEHKNIFDKFFRGTRGPVAEAKGLGIGLFIAKSIIEASGGSINFTSQEGVGSAFWFTLPVYHH